MMIVEEVVEEAEPILAEAGEEIAAAAEKLEPEIEAAGEKIAQVSEQGYDVAKSAAVSAWVAVQAALHSMSSSAPSPTTQCPQAGNSPPAPAELPGSSDKDGDISLPGGATR